MSVNPDGTDVTDYSDFEYQQTSFRVSIDEADTTGSPVRIIQQQDVDPLGGIGGLDNNEVAELVYLELQASVQHNQSSNDQDVGSETRFNGSVGANYPGTDSFSPELGSSLNADNILTSNIDDAGVEPASGSLSEDRIFAPFRVIKQPAFDDETNGTGGAGGSMTQIVERPFRQMTGRGPVLDSSDKMSALLNVRQEDEVITVNAEVFAHMIWDVAETSDAGRAFSVPMDD